jgi:predicted secreted Zn-dependent protease
MENLKTLDTKSLILDMTTNLSRIGNFVLDENYEKAEYFATELEKYIEELDTREYDERLQKWVEKTKGIIKNVRERNLESKYIADDSFTSGIILQNRAIHLL